MLFDDFIHRELEVTEITHPVELGANVFNDFPRIILASSLGEATVKIVVKFQERTGVAFHRLALIGNQLFKLGKKGIVGFFCDKTGDVGFDRFAYKTRIKNGRDRNFPNIGAALWADFQKPFVGKLDKCLANRLAADIISFGKFGFGQAHARQQIGTHNPFANNAMDLRADSLILRDFPVVLFGIAHQSLLAFVSHDAYYHTSQQNYDVILSIHVIVGVADITPIQRETHETNLEMVRTERLGQHR